MNELSDISKVKSQWWLYLKKASKFLEFKKYFNPFLFHYTNIDQTGLTITQFIWTVTMITRILKYKFWWCISLMKKTCVSEMRMVVTAENKFGDSASFLQCSWKLLWLMCVNPQWSTVYGRQWMNIHASCKSSSFLTPFFLERGLFGTVRRQKWKFLPMADGSSDL